MREWYLPILLSIGLFITACNSDDIGIETNSITTTSKPNVIRSFDDAVSIAEDVQSVLETTSRSSSRIVDVNKSHAITTRSSRSSSADTLLYVINYADSLGFALIPASTDEVPFLALTETGNIGNVDSIDNPGLDIFMKSAINHLKKPRPNVNDTLICLVTDDYVTYYKWSVSIDTTEVFIPKRLNTKWGQIFPAGLNCPNMYSGCYPLAVAEAMSIIEEPKSIQITYDDDKGNPYDYINLNWENIKKGNDNTALSLLCRELGHRMNADYSDPEETPVEVKIGYTVIKDILGSRANSYGMTKLNPYHYIKDGGVIVFTGGYNDEKNDWKGHTWIVDGLYHFDITQNEYIEEMIKYSSGLISYKVPELTNSTLKYKLEYQHINWGWNGKDNGFFLLSVFDTCKGDYYDDPNTDHSEHKSSNYPMIVQSVVIQ